MRHLLDWVSLSNRSRRGVIYGLSNSGIVSSRVGKLVIHFVGDLKNETKHTKITIKISKNLKNMDNMCTP
jgi:hypothetical protein